MTPHHTDAISKAVDPLWIQIRQLFAEHNFITVMCGFFVLLMVLSFYRLLRSISPALVGLILCLVLFILVVNWTQTGSEPRVFKPFIDWIAPFFRAPVCSK